MSTSVKKCWQVLEFVILFHRKTQLKLIHWLLDHSTIDPSQFHCRNCTMENISHNFCLWNTILNADSLLCVS